MLCSDNRQRWRWLDAMVALTENAMRGSFVPPSSLLSLLYNFIWPMLLKTSGKDRHMRVMEKWERRTWEFQSASCRYKHQALRLKLSPWFLCWILAQLMGDKLSLTTASLSFLSPSGDLRIGLIWDNLSWPHRPTFWSECWNPLQTDLNYLCWVLSCSQDDIEWF